MKSKPTNKTKIKEAFSAKSENENASDVLAIRFVFVRVELNKEYFEYMKKN